MVVVWDASRPRNLNNTSWRLLDARKNPNGYLFPTTLQLNNDHLFITSYFPPFLSHIWKIKIFFIVL